MLRAIGGGEIPAPPAVAEKRFVFVYLAMLAGPPAAGLIMTAVTGGSGALAQYRQRLTTWRVAPAWHAIAILTAPAAVLATDLLLSFASPGLPRRCSSTVLIRLPEVRSERLAKWRSFS